MNGKYLSGRPRRCDCQYLRDSAPNYAQVITDVLTGKATPTVNFAFSLDDSTTNTIYIATGVLSAALLVSAVVSRMK